MAAYDVIDKVTSFLGLSFGKASDPVQPSPDQAELLRQAQHRRNLLSEGIKENAAEIAERNTQMAKNTLGLACVRDELDRVTGKSPTAVCKPFEVPKAF